MVLQGLHSKSDQSLNGPHVTVVIGSHSDVPASDKGADRDWKFWCIILSLGICMVLTALEFTAIGTALPIIASDLHGSQFVWVGSAYTLASTALLPFCGGLAQVIGRRAVVLGSLVVFAIGSALCGAAPSMNFLIAGRTVQGLGAGGITALIQIILADLVPLRERGTFNGLMALAWTIGGGSGPVIGGAFAEAGQWRWLFYINIIISGVAFVMVFAFLRLRTPSTPWRERILEMDWIGNIILITATTSIVIALTWGGIQSPWTSPRILIPLILGLLGLVAFIIYEAVLASHPIVPFILMSDRTAVSGYIQNFLMGVILATLSYWLPVYFQACRDAGPTASGVDSFGLTFTTSPSAMVAGILIQTMSRYRPQMWCGWVLMIIGTGLLSTLDTNSSPGKAVGFEIITGVGIGIIYVGAYFPVLAPIPVTKSAPALAFYTCVRNFSLVWGVTIGGAILQNELNKRLPTDFLSEFPSGTEVAFSIIPTIGTLPEPLRADVRNAFAGALQVMWRVLTGIGGVGLLASFAMKDLPLHTSVDKNWERTNIVQKKWGNHDVEIGVSERIQMETQ